ncbi:MAG: hypothetical protein APF84_18505 [Gracilibacter sp. BRH_c7a]|nr:MAG: hypothetical protein APF84_18505 [Gracilibacter sp. BRH_c7a]
MSFSQFVKFDKMITPPFIKIIFWIGTVISVLIGIAILTEGGIAVLMGLATMILGPIGTRIYCELLMVIFKIYENLVEINNKLDEKKEEIS